MWTIEARFTVFGHTFPQVDLTPLLGAGLLAGTVALLIWSY